MIMIKYLKNLIRNNFGRSLEFRQIDFYSYSLLNSVLKPNKFLPYTTAAISPTALLHILNFITTFRPKNIVEIGSGISTVYIAELIKVNNLVTRFYSIENDLEWINIIKSFMNEDSKVDFIHAELNEEMNFHSHKFKWFDTKVLDQNLNKNEIDLLIIDGPPGNIPYARAGAFLYFKEQIEGQNLFYFFDDTDRKEERKIVESKGGEYQHFASYTTGGKKQPYCVVPVSYYK